MATLQRVDLAVGDDQDVGAVEHRVLGFSAQRGQTGFDAFLAPGERIADVQLGRAELVLGVAGDLPQLRHVGEGQHRLGDFQAVRRVDLVDAEQVGARADEGHQRHDQLLADRVDRRVGHLGKELAEVVVDRLVLGRQHGQRAVVAHRAGGFLAALGHRLEDELDVFLGVAEGLLTIEHGRGALGGHDALRLGTGVELDVDAATASPGRAWRRRGNP
jgi:hypothetical protein